MIEHLRVERFESTTIILPVVNESESLRQTIGTILAEAPRERIREILIVTAPNLTPAAAKAIDDLIKSHGEILRLHRQELPFLGGAIREAFELARGSHVLLMASDLETDPRLVGPLMAEAEKHPDAIITASRWRKGGSFHGYGKIKLVCNWIFQRCFSTLYASSLSDMTYAYRIFPTRLVQAIAWEELRHPFLLETLVKPLRLGAPVVEIPATWTARTEGTSQNTLRATLAYFPTGLKARFARPRTFLRDPPPR